MNTKHSTPKAARRVYVKQVRDTWMVIYADRKKGQRYSPAGFTSDDHSLHWVEEWVRSNPKLELTIAP